MLFLLSPNGTSLIQSYSNDALSVGNWYHVAATLNQATDKIQVYIAGLANGATVNYTTDIYDNLKKFIIGANDDSGGITDFFDGLIDEVIVWNTCLTAAEVLQVKNITAYSYAAFLLNMMR